MTSLLTSGMRRIPAVLAAVALLVILPAGQAAALYPDDGDDPGPTLTVLEWVGIFLGIPLLILVLITLAVCAPMLARSSQQRSDDQDRAGWLADSHGTEMTAVTRGQDVEPDSQLLKAVAHVPIGDGKLAPRDRETVLRAVRLADRMSGLPVAVFVGELSGDTRTAAKRVHASLPDPGDAVLVAVDPRQRSIEIITGADVRARLDDRSCGLAAFSMTTAFRAGNLSGGIADGVRVLAEHAGPSA